ncbi:MFS general substrate transporter [Sporormia fimetaria CBS 119925]|uniref:MFS general substrate transporter n=1 Tax=Sporormia fimetaria CBS 119925 TaxID=1340428 RepID=A0A6A6V051_9PLEO|nr:MFS general substrate transporter [Sporormia fimetaria CBS 119925]
MVWISLGLASAILLYGYDYVIVGTVSAMPRFQEDFGEQMDDGKWILPSDWLALWNVASPIGGMIGSVAGAWLQDRVGRRTALGVTSFLSALAVAVMYVSYIPAGIQSRRGLFLAGKFFQGGAVGAVVASVQTYMSETLPPVLRGSGMAFFPVFTLLGQLVGALVIFASLNKHNGYSIAFASQWPFSFVPIVVAFLIPESPAFYVRKNRMEKALAAQTRLNPPGADAHAIVEKIKADIEHEQLTATSSYMECFKRQNFRRTFIVVWANALPSLFGLNLLAKASYFMQVVGMKANLSIIFLILGIVLGLLSNAISVWVVSRVDRRPLVYWPFAIVSLLWLSMGVANSFNVTSPIIWWTAVCMMLVTVVCGVSVWPVSYSVSGETPALQLRAKTQGIGWTASAAITAIANVALPYIFNPDTGNLRGKVGYTYVGLCVIASVVSYFVVPEMKGRTVGEIDRMFELGLSARKFKSYVMEDERVPPEKPRWL